MTDSPWANPPAIDSDSISVPKKDFYIWQFKDVVNYAIFADMNKTLSILKFKEALKLLNSNELMVMAFDSKKDEVQFNDTIPDGYGRLMHPILDSFCEWKFKKA